MNLPRLPADFLWGVATSAYQIEGGWDTDGRGESIWDRFSHTPGNIADGDTGDVACDHYRRWREDVALLDELGVGAYRFSVSWPRVLPEGTGRVNPAGLAFYDALIDHLLEFGIEPILTLHHWDLPQALQPDGGWAARSTVDAFTEFTGVMASRLGDRVRWWITQNEPRVAAQLGHETGEFAPGIRDLNQSLAVAHHLLLSHGRAVDVLRAGSPRARVGIALDPNPVVPASNHPSAVEAARRRDGKDNRWYLDPIAGRPYPEDVVAALQPDMSFIRPGDMEVIARPVDFLGVNYYRREVEGTPRALDRLPVTAMGWEIYPQGLTEVLASLKEQYPFPAYLVSENGAAFDDVPKPDGAVDDSERVAYLQSHISAVADAVAAGVPVLGYLVWSLLDNFEWAQGFGKRFGLVRVDFATQERIIKASGRWFRDLVTGYSGTLGL